MLFVKNYDTIKAAKPTLTQYNKIIKICIDRT